jgi:hypothetical protein
MADEIVKTTKLSTASVTTTKTVERKPGETEQRVHRKDAVTEKEDPYFRVESQVLTLA